MSQLVNDNNETTRKPDTRSSGEALDPRGYHAYDEIGRPMRTRAQMDPDSLRQVTREKGISSIRKKVFLVGGGILGATVMLIVLAMGIIVPRSVAHQHNQALNERYAVISDLISSSKYQGNAAAAVKDFKTYNPTSRVTYIPADSTSAVGDDGIPDAAAVAMSEGKSEQHGTAEGYYYLMRRLSDGSFIVLQEDVSSSKTAIRELNWILAGFGLLGVFSAFLGAAVAANAGTRPIRRLQHATDFIARTDDLRPIPVEEDDEIGRLTESFNGMLAALQASRTRQAELVADAGHELRTPLTSLRTNIELVMFAQSTGRPLPLQELKEIEADIVAQIEELSNLIGDLVDLAREESNSYVDMHYVDISQRFADSISRVQRRRSDVTFEADLFPWYVFADPFSLSRALTNLLDNAAKWSPVEGVVRITMQQVSVDTVRIDIADQGPGILESERNKIFERFYRSMKARTMPGSGLGLAIVKQVIERADGSIQALDNPGGGALMRIMIPGLNTPPDDASVMDEESKTRLQVQLDSRDSQDHASEVQRQGARHRKSN